MAGVIVRSMVLSMIVREQDVVGHLCRRVMMVLMATGMIHDGLFFTGRNARGGRIGGTGRSDRLASTPARHHGCRRDPLDGQRGEQ